MAPYSPVDVSHHFNRFLRSAGVTGSAHTLRHWFGTNLYAQSHDIRLTQEMLGHARVITTAIYTAFDQRGAGELNWRSASPRMVARFPTEATPVGRRGFVDVHARSRVECP